MGSIKTYTTQKDFAKAINLEPTKADYLAPMTVSMTARRLASTKVEDWVPNSVLRRDCHLEQMIRMAMTMAATRLRVNRTVDWRRRDWNWVEPIPMGWHLEQMIRRGMTMAVTRQMVNRTVDSRRRDWNWVETIQMER